MWTPHAYLISLIFITLSVVSCSSQNPTPILPPRPTLTPRVIPSVTPTTFPVPEMIEGSFRNQIGILEDNMPRSQSEAYVIPTAKEQGDFAELIALIFASEAARAAGVATKNHYRLHYYVDRGDDYATSYLLREERPIQKGWGLYAYRLDSTSNIVVEAPHPLADRRTPSIALDIYRALDARALLIAGAHRNANRDGSADVAHAPESIFQSVHEALSQEIQAEAEEIIVLQIHGFHSSKHEGYPEVVFGLGKNANANEVAWAQKIKDALSERGISAGLCVGMDSGLEDLCAKTNIQSFVTNQGAFIHIELDEKLRKNDDAFVAALVQVFNQ